MSEYPLYRLHRYDDPHEHFVVDVVLAAVDFDAPSYDPEDSWTHTVKSKTLSITRTREAAESVLRLQGIDAYQDWTQPGGWDSPMVALPYRSADE